MFLLLPRMLLWKPSRGVVLKGKLQERFAAFPRRELASLFSQSEKAAKSAAAVRQRRQRTHVDSVEQRAESPIVGGVGRFVTRQVGTGRNQLCASQ